MATHDYVIDNQTAANLRADLNNALQAIVTQNSGSSAPTTTFSNMLWYDTGNNQIKKRDEADSAWITLGTIDEATGKFTPNAAITTSEIAAATLVTSTDTIASNDNDTTIPTSAAVKDFVEANAVTTSNVLAAMAGATTDDVGSYIIAWNTTGTSVAVGGTISGSNLRYVNARGSNPFETRTLYNNNTFPTTNTTTLTGTWRAITHGQGRYASGLDYFWAPSLWLKVS